MPNPRGAFHSNSKNLTTKLLWETQERRHNAVLDTIPEESALPQYPRLLKTISLNITP